MTGAPPPALAAAFATTRDLVEPALAKALSRLDPATRRVAGYHLGWTDPQGAPTGGSGGKLLRPSLALLGAQMCGGDPADAVPAAIAVELVHNFSLLHDDVMDGDEQRRHRPAAWTVFGVPAAVLAGDALLILALEVLTDRAASGAPTGAEVTAMVLGAASRLVAGQSADMAFEARADVGLEEGLGMSDAKTGALMRCAAACGALAAGADGWRVDLLGRFGEHLGRAFQLVDDVLGIWGAPEVTGKPALADLRSRKKSLPVLAALAEPGPEGTRLRALYRRPEPFTEAELPGIADAIQRAGGRVWAERRAERELDEARGCLDRATGDPGAEQQDGRAAARASMLALADFVTGRDR